MITKDTLKNYRAVTKELSESIQTNMLIETVMGLANEQLSSNRDYNISSQALSGTGSLGLPSYAMPNSNLYMMEIDENRLQTIKDAMKTIMEGR